MEFLTELWLPILVNGVVLFFASFTAWVLLPHHFGDKKKLPDEEAVMKVIADLKVPAGNYLFPHAGTKQEQNSKEYVAKYTAGPRGLLDVYAMPSMPLNMLWTVVFFLVTSAVIGYITLVACPIGDPDTNFMKVFRVAGTIGILTHASSGVLNGIWFKKRLITDIIDGIMFGLILGLIFALSWPTA